MSKTIDKYLLALDASSSIVGYTLFDKATKEIVFMGHYILDKDKSLLERALDFEQEVIKKLKDKYGIELGEMVIEEAFTAMYGTTSNAQTTATLLQINAMFQLIGHYNNMKIHTITVSESRKNTFPGIKIRTLAKQAQMKEKEYCFKLATENYLKTQSLPTKVISKGPRKGQTVFEDHASDMVDSFIVGMGYLNKK